MAPLLPLPPNQAHLWFLRYLEVSEPSLLAGWEALLDDDERQRKARYLFEHSQREFLATRALVRTVLSRYAEVAPARWQFRDNAWGRPEIAAGDGDSPIRFNLSNCRGMVVCLVAHDREVGIDVEDLDRRGPSLDVAGRFFAPLEVGALRALPITEQRRRFFDYWTLKEAYIKARGMGLAIPLDHFWFALEPSRSPRIAFDPRLVDDPASWQFDQRELDERFVIATAIRRDPPPQSDGKDIELVIRETVPLADDQRG